MKSPLRAASLAAVIVLPALALGASATDPGLESRELLIGSCSVLSGPLQTIGNEQLQGASAYFELVNREQGGVHGRKLRLISEDDGYDADKAILCFNRLKQKGVFAGAFFTGSATSVKYALMAESNKMPALGFIAGPKFLYEPVRRYVFAVRASFHDEAVQVVDRLWNEAHARRIAFVFQDDAMGASGSESLRAALKRLGADPVASVSMGVDSNDLQRVIEAARAAKPDAVVIVAAYAPSAKFVKLSRSLGWKPLLVAIGPRDAFLEPAGPSGEGVILTQILPPPTSDLPAVKRFRKALAEFSPEAPANSYYCLEGFIDAEILVEGLRRAGTDPDREKLVDALESMRAFDVGLGPTMKASYGPDRHGAFDSIYFTVVHGGKSVPLKSWPRVGNVADPR